MAEEAGAGFDWEAGPLIRGRLIQLADEEHVLLITMHHIVSDWWSMGVLFKELSTLYGAFCARGRRSAGGVGSAVCGLCDVAAEADGRRILKEQAEYWKKNLEVRRSCWSWPADSSTSGAAGLLPAVCCRCC